MASKVQVLLLLVLLNVLFCTLVSAGHSCENCGGSDHINGGDGGNGASSSGGGGGASGRCPIDVLRLRVCANLLGVGIGTPTTRPCCSLIAGLTDLEATVCLCTAIKANILGINLNVPLALRLILNNCGRNPPPGFIC